MPTSEHKFSIDELIEALLRDQGIHEGHWALNVESLASGTTVNSPAGAARRRPCLLQCNIMYAIRLPLAAERGATRLEPLARGSRRA